MTFDTMNAQADFENLGARLQQVALQSYLEGPNCRHIYIYIYASDSKKAPLVHPPADLDL